MENKVGVTIKFLIHFFCFTYVEAVLFTKIKDCRGSRDEAVVRAPASHQCGPGSNPRVDINSHLFTLFPVRILTFFKANATS